MEKSFEEVFKVLNDDKEYPGHRDYRSCVVSTQFSQWDFKSPDAEQFLSIVRSSQSGTISHDVEIFYFYTLLAGNPEAATNFKDYWKDYNLVEIEKAEFDKLMEHCFEGLYHEYRPPLHYGQKPKRFYKRGILSEEEANTVELIMETEGPPGSGGEFILINWHSTA